MIRRTATFLAVTCALACGPVGVPGEFDLRPVTLAPCALSPVVPARVQQGEVVRIPLSPSRSNVTLAVVTVPAGAEATLEGEVLVFRPGFESLGASSVLEVEFTCGGATTTVPVRVPVMGQVKWGAPVTWAAAAGPDAREHPLLFIDPAAPDVLWLYGGFSFVPRQFTVVNDLWRFDLTANSWTKVDAMNAPLLGGGRISAGLRAGEFILFGGQTPADDVSSEVYRFDVTQTPVRFERLTTSGSAPIATLGALVPDAARRRLISFGGYTGSDISNAVHALSLDTPNAWSSEGATGPSPRYGFFAARDGERLIVFSGAQRPSGSNQINAAGDVWALELATLRWTKLADATVDAPGRRNGCGGIDPATRRFYVWSGTPDGSSATPMLSVLELSRTPAVWSRVSAPMPPTARGSCSAIVDAPRRRMLFGFGNTLGQQFADLQVLELGDAPAP